MIFDNPFQEMLLKDLREHKAVMVDESLLGLYFPIHKHEPIWFESHMHFIKQGFPPGAAWDPFDEGACRIWCSRNNLLMHWKHDGEVLFVLRGD